MSDEDCRWFYKFPGDFYAFGPTTKRFTNEQAARAYIAASWGFTHLPRGTEVWKAYCREYN